MAWLTAYNPHERNGHVLLHYTLLDGKGKPEKELCTLHGEVKNGRVYAREYGPEINPSARAALTIEHVD